VIFLLSIEQGVYLRAWEALVLQKWTVIRGCGIDIHKESGRVSVAAPEPAGEDRGDGAWR
jgi:hypothetical protein